MAKQSRSLTGKVAVVTGAAGGVGKATAIALAREGARVALADLSQDAVEAAAREAGTDAIGVAVDVTDRPGFTAFLDEVERRLGPIDIVVNNAAIMPIGHFEQESDATTARQIDVNLHAVIHSTKQAAKRMLPRSTGHIVNVASGAGWIAGGGGATYCGTKFGVVGFSESVSLELRGTGVEISVIAPAVIKTEMSRGLKEIRGIRAVTPEEVAAGIVGALKRPRFAVFVPSTIGVMALLFSAIPYRVRHFLARAAKSDKLLLDFDPGARADYEARVAGKPAAAPPAGEKSEAEKVGG